MVNMSRVECYCFALFLLCGLPIGTKASSYSGTHIDPAKPHQWELAENANLECLRAFKSCVVDSKGYLEQHWNLESISQEIVCDLAGVVCSSTGLLVSLDLANAGLSGSFPTGLSKCSSLTSIILSYNNFKGPLPLDLCLQLPFLIELDLAWNFLSGDVKLLNCSVLAKLHLSRNQFSGEIACSNCSSLVELDLSYNNFSGVIPVTLSDRLLSSKQIYKCKWLQSLTLAQNRFTGPLPADLCKQMPLLRDMDLSHNEFIGDIPAALGDCKALSTLRLQNNLLSGEIPSALGVLPKLSTLNLSSNALSGSIPSSLSFSAVTFGNNPHLCGPPLPSRCAFKKQSSLHMLKIAGGTIFALLFLAGAVIIFCRLRKHAGRVVRERDEAFVQIFDKHLRVTWEDLQRATSDFSQANLIGMGGSSKVYKGKLLNGRMVAIKVLIGVHEPVEQEMELNSRKQFFTELEVLGKLRHRNLVRILGYCYNLDTMTIILDFMPLGSLNALLHSDTPCHGSFKSRQSKHLGRLKMDLRVRLGILMDIAEGLLYLHHEYDGKRCVVHGDLKPGNVLLDEDMGAHIADFGLSRMVGNINTGLIATPSRQIVSGAHWCFNWYTAPEVAQQGVLSRKADIFSFGVTMLEVITGERPNSFRLEEDQTLADWVGKAVEKGAPHSVVAPLLKETDWKQSSDDITVLLRLGCACASHVPAARPDIRQVRAFLRDLVNKQPLTKQSSTPVDHDGESELWILS